MMPLLICGLRYFQMFTSIRIVKRRFDKLIQVLNEINLQNPTPEIITDDTVYKSLEPFKTVTRSPFSLLEVSLQQHKKRYEMENPDLKRLLIIRDLYNRLYLLTEIVNRYFGISMLVNLGNDFISITSNCYWIFINFKNFTSTTKDFLQIAGSAVWSVPHLLNVLILAILCEKTVQCVSRKKTIEKKELNRLKIFSILFHLQTTSIALGLHRINIDNMNDNHNSVVSTENSKLYFGYIFRIN